MIYYEYDNDGWLLGWHEDPQRPSSTSTTYEPIPSIRARWVNGAWTEDASRETQESQAALQRMAVQAVQLLLGTQAQAWGYDSIFTACTYADEPTVPQF